MAYRITIEKVEHVVSGGKVWKKLTDADVPQQYGYVESMDKVDVTTELFRQEVKTLDLEAVIRAINRI